MRTQKVELKAEVARQLNGVLRELEAAIDGDALTVNKLRELRARVALLGAEPYQAIEAAAAPLKTEREVLAENIRDIVGGIRDGVMTAGRKCCWFGKVKVELPFAGGTLHFELDCAEIHNHDKFNQQKEQSK